MQFPKISPYTERGNYRVGKEVPRTVSRASLMVVADVSENRPRDAIVNGSCLLEILRR